MTLVENKTSSQYDGIMNSISAIKKSDTQAIKLGEKNSSLISENTGKITSHIFDIDSLDTRILDLKNHLIILQDNLDDIRNRRPRKTLIFRTLGSKNHWENIGTPPQLFWKMKYKKLLLEEILAKIERAHWPKENQSRVSQ